MDAERLVYKYDLVERRHLQFLAPPDASFVEEGMQDFLRRVQSTKAKSGVMRSFIWAVKDKKSFDSLLNNLEKFIGALEHVLQSLGLYEADRRLIQEAIGSIREQSALQSLVVLDASETDSIISEAARRRLLELREGSVVLDSDRSFSREHESSTQSDNATFYSSLTHQHEAMQTVQSFSDVFSMELIQRHVMQRSQLDPGQPPSDAIFPEQNQRIIQELRTRHGRGARGPTLLDPTGWGSLVAKFKEKDISAKELQRWWASLGDSYRCKKDSPQYPLARLLYNVQEEAFLSASVVDVDELRARISMEGPPDSPYSGGIFHLEVCVDGSFPITPPRIRFLTRVYHPNIDHTGKLCLGWSPVFAGTSLCILILSLMSDPDIDDPLVLEIAATYIEDRELFINNAKEYTARYATLKQSFPDHNVFPME